MSHNIPFLFNAGGGQSAPAPPSQQSHAHPSNAPDQAQNMPTQQAAFHSNAALPGVDMSALEGISPEQLAAIARLFQAGALQLPPQQPTAPSQPPTNTAVPPALAPPLVSSQVQRQNGPTPHEDDIDMDKDEGEIEEGEVDDNDKPRDFLRPPPTGPRSRSVTPRGMTRGLNDRKSSPRPPLPKQQQSQSKHSQLQASPPSRTNGQRVASKDAASKMFVLEMVNAGYSFEQLVSLVNSPKALVRMFEQLNLPIPSAYLQKQSFSSDQPAAGHLSTQEEVPKAAAKRSAPPKAAPVSRNEYLARLQAAKNKKAEAVAAPPAADEPEEEPVMPMPISKPTQAQQTDALPGSSIQPSQATKSVDKTALVRQKLEALKAQQAAKQKTTLPSNSASSPGQKAQPPSTADREALSSPSHRGLGAGLGDIASQVAKSTAQPPTEPIVTQSSAEPPASVQSLFSPTPPTPNRSFSGLPGLFMLGDHSQMVPSTQRQQDSAPLQAFQPIHTSSFPQAQSTTVPDTPQSSAVPTTSAAPSLLSKKRPVASDFDDLPTASGHVKRPFGGSRGASEDESYIIEVSDDEDEPEEMEVEEIANPTSSTKPFRDAAPLRNFPSAPNLSAQTSGQTTPGGTTYEQRLKDIEEMKRRIEEAEKRKKVNGKSAAGQTAPSNTTAFAPNAATIPSSTGATEPHLKQPALDSAVKEGLLSTDGPLEAVTENEGPPNDRASAMNRPKSAATLAREQERENLRLQLGQLEQAEFTDMNEAVAAAVSEREHEPLVSDTGPQALDVTETETMPSMSGALPNVISGSVSEEGELSDDSMSNLYDVEDSQRHEPNASGLDDDGAVDVERIDGSGISSLPEESNGVDSVSSVNVSAQRTPEDTKMTEAVDEDLSEELQGAEGDDDVEGLYEDRDASNKQPDPAEPQREESGLSSLEQSANEVFGDETGDDEDSDASSASSTDQDAYEPDAANVEASSGTDEMNHQLPAAAPPGIAPSQRTAEFDIADSDLAPELQPTEEELAESTNEATDKPKTRYVSYRSPLMEFKDYIYHPQFLDTVPGGYKSLTYAHNIDPVNQICPFEATGGKCNDKNCQYQHFSSMALTDNERLKHMGTKNVPAHSPEDQKRWNEGLGAVIKGLRTTSLGRDAGAIAAKIAEFRREFVADPTKVLNLG